MVITKAMLHGYFTGIFVYVYFLEMEMLDGSINGGIKKILFNHLSFLFFKKISSYIVASFSLCHCYAFIIDLQELCFDYEIFSGFPS